MKNKVVDKLAVLEQNGVIEHGGIYYVVYKGVVAKECVKYIDAVLTEMSYSLEQHLYYGLGEDTEDE